ncbi:MAG: hypothetical protein ACC628_12530 [Pirellulaceae bacterium]
MTAGSQLGDPHLQSRSGRVRWAWACGLVVVAAGVWLGQRVFWPDGASTPPSKTALRAAPSPPSLTGSTHSDTTEMAVATTDSNSPPSQQDPSPNHASIEPKVVPATTFPGGIKVIYRLPRTDSEIQAAHERDVDDVCETIPPGEPIERRGFLADPTSPERRELGGTTSVLSSRQHLLSVGIDFLDEDRRDLPLLSGGEILRFFHGRYVMLQVRVRKSADSQMLYLHHRPLGGMTTFEEPHIAEAVTSGVEASFRNYRSLGLVLKPGDVVGPENLRTLAIVHKSERLALSAARVDDLTYRYEYVFVRAHDKSESGSQRLAVHAFVTSENRTQLHYLQFANAPTQPGNCSVTTMICFTEYMQLGLRPKTSATRSMVYYDRATYEMTRLDQYARRQGWSGDALDNLSDILDAIIAGRMKDEG